MASKGPVTEVEREYVRSRFPQLGVAEMARIMGRSRMCVNNIVRHEGLRDRCNPKPEASARVADEPDGTLSRLEELRDTLRASLLSAGPRELPGLAREYRATVETIKKMEGGPDDEAASALDAVAKSIASRMSS